MRHEFKVNDLIIIKIKDSIFNNLLGVIKQIEYNFQFPDRTLHKVVLKTDSLDIKYCWLFTCEIEVYNPVLKKFLKEKNK